MIDQPDNRRRLSSLERFALVCGLAGMVVAGGFAGWIAWGDLSPPPFGSQARKPITGWATVEHVALYVLGGMAAGLAVGGLGGGLLALPAALVAQAVGNNGGTPPQPAWRLRVRSSLWIAAGIVLVLVWFFILREH